MIISNIIGGGNYESNAVNFDGSTLVYKGSALTGSGLTTGVTVVFSFNSSYTSGIQLILDMNNDDSDSLSQRGVRVALESATGVIEAQAYNSAGTQIESVQTSETDYRDGLWHNVGICLDTSSGATGNTKIVVDGTTEATSTASHTGTQIALNAPFVAVGARGTSEFPNGSGHFRGDLCCFHIKGSYEDLSDSAIWAQYFLNGRPRRQDASKLVSLSGETDDWHTNKGTGGGFTEVGALTTSTNLPVEAGS